MMTTLQKTAKTTRKKLTTELTCVCGRTLTVSVPTNGWLTNLLAVASANRWKLCNTGDRDALGETYPAYCPDCHR